MGGLDLALFRAINGWPDSLAPIMRLLSTANGTLAFKIVILLIVAAMIWKGGAFRWSAILSLAAFPVTDFLCNCCKKLWPMHRPFQELENVIVWVGRSDSMGTASSHAGNLAAVATVMTLRLGPRWGAPWIVLAFLVGLSRIYVGVHYPSQVALGWIIGVAVGLMVHHIARSIHGEKKPVVTESAEPQESDPT